MAKRKCYGYTINPDGELEINPYEAKVVCWVFERYLAGNSLGKIAAGLERQDISSLTGRSKWNRETIDKIVFLQRFQLILALKSVFMQVFNIAITS